MTRIIKSVFGFIGLVLLFCAGLTLSLSLLVPIMNDETISEVMMAADATFVEEPVAAHAIGQQILPYEIPTGFAPASAFTLLGAKGVILAAEDGRPMTLALISFPSGMSQDDVAGLRDSIDTGVPGVEEAELRTIEVREITVNGEQVLMEIEEGRTPQQMWFRRMSAEFTAIDGVEGAFTLQSRREAWDEAAVETFLESIR